MAEEKAGKRMNFQVWWLSSLITWGQLQSQQQTQSTWSTQTGAQQSTSTPFLPWITNNQEIQAQNKIQTNNGFIEWIQQWKIQTNIQLPWITTKPQTGATLDTTTMKQKRQSYIYASNNNINTKSINEQIEEERASGSKVLWQTGKILKTYRETPINNFKKRWARAIADSGLPWYFVDKTLNKAWLDISVKDSVNEVARKMALQYQDSVNEKFQKKVEKNLDPYIKEKYDNASITDLIWQWDGAWAWYKMRRWTVENRNMIPEMWLMFINPYVWLAAMGTDVYIQENQWTFEDMMENWATYDEAKNGAVAVWILNAWIELFMERFLWWTKWAWATAFRRLFLKNAQREVVKTATKKWMAEIFARWVWEWLKWSMVEWFEEVLQQIVGNIMVKMVNPDRDITEWTRESFEWWFYNLFNPIWWWVNMVNDVNTNKQIQKNADIEALKYVSEWEQRKAQRMQSQRVQEAKERLKQKFLQNEKNPTMDNGYTPTPEQAQQRATEKEENEQYEDELRAEQNRENSKYQETEWENSWLSNSNDYSTDTTISKDYSHSDMVNTDSTNVESNGEVNSPVTDSTFFSTDENGDYIIYNGKKIYAWSKAWTKDQFTQLSDNTPYNPEYEEYFKNFQRLIQKLSDKNVSKRESEIIWRTQSGKEVRMTKRALRHIFETHWKFNIHTLLEAINNPSKQKRESELTWKNKNKRPYVILDLPWTNKKIIVAIKPNNWSTNTENADFYYVVSSRESNTPTTQADDVVFQKAWEEEYVPWVARKSEKNISWKEGINLRSKLTKETVKQLAEKYWVRVDVIEWMIKILDKWRVEWYAYWKYLDQLLTLSEQIKESTAPHELLHAIFDMIDPETKTYLISQVMASEWWTAEQSEEWLADSFSNFFRTGKIESAPKSTRWKIKIFFKRVRSFINGMNKWRNELEQIFTDILEANGIEDLQWRIDRNENLQKAKEKMRKRFMEYEKNAEKVKNKENNWKYQTVYHWWPNEFDRFDHLHMWEWEWHQAHWWGHYVAIDPDTARRYAENFGRYKWKTVYIDSKSTDEDLVAYKVLSNLQMWMSIDDSIEDVKSYYRDEKKFYEKAYKEDGTDRFKELAERCGRLIKAVDKLNKSDFNTKRNFYEVEIPDPVKADTPTWSNYLEEKWEFTERQLNNFKKILGKYNLPYTNKWLNEWHIKDWEDLYSALSEDFISDAWVSKFLEKMWYDGIHYFWGRDWEAYVIFNDDSLEIKNHEKYQKMKEKRYRGQEEMWDEWRWIKHNKTAVTEYTEWWVFVTPYKEDAVKYGDYILEFDKLKENTVTSKEADKLQERATKQVENDLKNQIDTDYLIEQMALGRLRWFAEYMKKPFVETGNPWWEKWEAVFFEDIAKKYNVKYQRVYHWSPNEFDKFDSSHMWEGEWNQAHGRWHYVAVNQKTARTYAQEPFRKNEVEIKWKTMTRTEDIRDIPYALRTLYRDLYSFFSFWYYDFDTEINNAIDQIKKEYEDTVSYYEDLVKNNTKPPVEVSEKDLEKIKEDRKKSLKEFREALEFIEELKPEDVIVRELSDRRNFYEVEIPDPIKADTPTWSNYLEEQATIKKSEQGKFVKLYKEKTWKDLELFSSYRDGHIDWLDVYRSLDQAFNSNKEASKFLESIWYDWIHYDGQRDGECYVIFNDNDLEIKNHEKYQKAEYEYDENWNITNLKFGDNSERDPSIFWAPTREEQIEDDKENEKWNPFYNAWMRYNNQNYKDDQLTMDEFMQWISERWDKEQEEYNKKMKDLSEVQNDPQLLDLQLRAVKLMEEEWKVGKKFWKNVSKEVRDRQQREVETKREKLIEDILNYMYPWLKTEEITYDMQKEADKKEADWEMLGREDIEEKLKYFKKDKNGNREAKEIKIENPQIKLDKILSAWKFDEIFPSANRVIEFTTPNWQRWVLDSTKEPAKYKRTMTRINDWTVKTKVKMKDITQETRADEKMKAQEQAERERIKKERQEAFDKRKKEEYKKMVRMKAFQKLIDMQWLERYPFLSEDEIRQRRWFTPEEWKKITEQEEIKLPKKRKEKAISDFNKAVDSYVKNLIEWLSWQNNMKRNDYEKNLWEIWDIDIEVLLGRDEEKGQKEVEEFEKLAKESKEEENKTIDEWKSEFEKEMDKKTRKQKKQAEKLTTEWKEMFRKAEEKRNERYANKEEKTIDEVKTVEEAKELTKDSRRKRTKKFWKDTTFTDLIQPIGTRIEKISPAVYREMMRFEQRIAIKTNTRMKQVEDFVKMMSKIRSSSRKEYLNLTLHLLNWNVGTANQMLEKYWVSIPRQVLDEIWADAEDVWYTMNYEWFYYPRKVKDVKEFLDRFAKTENKNVQSEIEKIIKKKREQARKRWEEFTPQQEADLINQLLMDGEVEWITLWSWHMKKRKVDSITKNMLEFYEDPVDALLQYITWMTEAIEKARFLWQWTKWEIKTLWEYIADEWVKWWEADELRKLLLSRFNYAPMWEFMSVLKVAWNIIHLWSLSSALSQLWDVSFSLIENSMTDLIQWLTKKYNLDLDALWITNRWEELKKQWKNETWLEKTQRFVFKYTLFNFMDQFWKKALVVSTLNKLIRYAKNNDPQLRKDLSRRFDDSKMIDWVIEDLKNWVMSENVNLFLFTKLADVQPLTRMQMPRTYLQAWNWRILYAFKTFTIKRLDYIIQKSKRELQTKPTAQALRTLVAMWLIMMLCDAWADELKDAIFGRKYSSTFWRIIEWNGISKGQLTNRFWDEFLKLRWLTKYSIYQARTQWIKATIEDIFFSLPWLDIVTYPLQDLQDLISEDGLDWSQAESRQLIPLIWKLWYWRWGKWQTKQQKSLNKEMGKTTSKSKSSKKNTSGKGQLSR